MKGMLVAVCITVIFPFFIAHAHAFDPNSNCGRAFTGGPGISRPPEWEYGLSYVWTIDIDGKKYDVLYDGYITNVTASTDRRSIEFDTQTGALSQLIRLPRALIDSTQDNQDIPFTVIVNGEVSEEFEEDVVPSSGDRVLCITLPADKSFSRIEIIGTTIAPEFGSIAAVASIVMAGIVAFRMAFGKGPKN